MLENSSIGTVIVSFPLTPLNPSDPVPGRDRNDAVPAERFCPWDHMCQQWISITYHVPRMSRIPLHDRHHEDEGEAEPMGDILADSSAMMA